MNSLLKIVALSLMLSCFGSAFAQAPSDSVYYNRLFYTCRVWGHLKYYHTEVAKGNVNWDDALIESLPGIKIAPDNKSFNDSLLLMINRAGEMEVSSDTLPEIIDSLNNNSDYSWIQNSIFSESVQDQLEIIRSRFRPQENVYVGQKVTVTFDKDTLYHSDSYHPSESMRILALFRYWNIIHYFFPYKNIMDQDWETTLSDFIPQIVNASDALSYSLTFKQFHNRINDSHGFFSSPPYWTWDGAPNYPPPFQVKYIDNEMVITKVLKGISGVGVGDIIKEIDGEDIYVLRDSIRKYAHGSNPTMLEKGTSDMILRGPQGSFSITVDNGINVHTESLIRKTPDWDNDFTSTDIPIWRDSIINEQLQVGIVDLERLFPHQVTEMINDLWETDVIIFDIRNYPKRVAQIIGNFLLQQSVVYAKIARPDINYPGVFKWFDQPTGEPYENTYSGRIILLFDERTISYAEWICMRFEQVPNVIKIGSTTAGADGNVSWISLPGKIKVLATFLGVYYPDNTPTQRVGIIPDIEVHPTIDGIRAGKDEVMDFALNYYAQSIDESKEKHGLTIYPNPAQEYLNYQLDGYGNSDGIDIQILNFWGNGMKQIYSNSKQGRVDISDLPSGTYYVKVASGNLTYTKHLIINR